MTTDTQEKSKGGCFKFILAGLGFLLLISPLNPFIEYKHFGEDEFLTNSSWLVMSVLCIAYWVIVLPFITNKRK